VGLLRSSAQPCIASPAQLFKIGWLSAFAFGQTISRPTHQQDAVNTCLNFLWLPCGCLFALLHLVCPRGAGAPPDVLWAS
jgi:hypothetical protein